MAATHLRGCEGSCHRLDVKLSQEKDESITAQREKIDQFTQQFEESRAQLTRLEQAGS